MYYPYFIAYMVCGFVVGLFLFFWALDNNQFQDQQRARFLPFEGEVPSAPAKAQVPRRYRVESYALFGLACLGLMVSMATVVYALWHAN